jgi:hypothetical protein
MREAGFSVPLSWCQAPTRLAAEVFEPAFEYVRKGTAEFRPTRYALRWWGSQKSSQRAEDQMSRLNGDKARFQKNRMRKLKQRERSRALMTRLAAKRVEETSGAVTHAASLAMHDEGGPTRAQD